MKINDITRYVKIIANMEFETFDHTDHECWPDVTGTEPQIAYGVDGWVGIIDNTGLTLQQVNEKGDHLDRLHFEISVVVEAI